MTQIKKLNSFILYLLGSSYALGAGNISAKAESLLKESGFFSYLTNSLLTGLFISFLIVAVVRFITRKGVKIIPHTGQACIEHLIDSIGGILEPIVGKHLFEKALPLLLGYFIFIVIQNLSGLFPGVSSIGFKHEGHIVGILRPMNSDLNATLALALIASLAWIYFCLKFVGVHGLYEHIFGNKSDRNEIPKFIYLLLFFVFFGVGLIECLSILFRVVSLSFRLYGNVFGGENLLHNMYEMSEFLASGGLATTGIYSMVASFSPELALFLSWVIGKLGYFLPLPFYFLEFLVGIVQAFVFTLLVAVYMGLICNHEEEKTLT
ncbi:MAG: F0F1 ATP synthase subunit A [Puniceicoccales bacterium]|jgi:F-type H+-transporting ATPase subunit a|nr:F0F1 ATP synthase subunit A [Puniceicoccales bacterium]